MRTPPQRVKTQNYYNQISKGYEELYEKEQLKKIELIKNLQLKGKLLDIGAGSGISTEPFLEKCECYSLDPAKEFLKKSKAKKVFASAEKIPFGDNCFDNIISITASQNFKNLKKAINEIKRVAKKDAVIIISILKTSKKLPELKSLLKDHVQIERDKDIFFFNKSGIRLYRSSLQKDL